MSACISVLDNQALKYSLRQLEGTSRYTINFENHNGAMFAIRNKFKKIRPLSVGGTFLSSDAWEFYIESAIYSFLFY